MVRMNEIAAGAGAAVALTLGRQVTSIIPGGGIGRAVVGGALVWGGGMLDSGPAGAFAVGFGAGLIVDGILSLVLVAPGA